MNLQDQITFMSELETLFLDRDRQYCDIDKYDGHYREAADSAGEVMESLWRLQDLEK